MLQLGGTFVRAGTSFDKLVTRRGLGGYPINCNINLAGPKDVQTVFEPLGGRRAVCDRLSALG